MNGKAFLFLGDVPSAVLLFEAGCQLEPENPESWFLLGTSQVSINFLAICRHIIIILIDGTKVLYFTLHILQQAKNEQDPLALAALRQSLKLEPENLEAILSLAASFTNESYQAHACHALQGNNGPP